MRNEYVCIRISTLTPYTYLGCVRVWVVVVVLSMGGWPVCGHTYYGRIAIQGLLQRMTYVIYSAESGYQSELLGSD